MVNVPQQYQSYVQDAADYLGIPYDVVAEQIMQESSFDPHAQSPVGAEGIAQFMPGTFATWGPRGGSPWNVADAFYAYKNFMKHLLNAEGGSVRRALAAYNAGEGNVSAGLGYADSILSASGQSSSITGGSGSGNLSSSTASGGNPQPATIDPATLAQEYGFTDAFLNANPELKKIFQQAVAKQWSTDRFKAALMGTQWWKTHSETERTYLTNTFTDPATAKQQFTQAWTHAQQLMDQLGFTKDMNPKQWTATLNALAYNIAAKGWSDDQVKYYAGQFIKLSSGKMSGDAETQYSNGLQYAYSMGVKMSDSWYQTMVQNIERGTATFADLQAGIRNQAKAQYSQFSQQIDGGQTIQDIASPYIQQMGQILEINPQTLSAFDPTVKAALTYKDPKTGAPGQALWQFEDSLRQDPRWLKTDNARDSLMSTAHGVLQSFGFSI
jgi:hypothetical protein